MQIATDMSTSIHDLESSLKSTLHSLSLILAYYASVTSLNATAYAPTAPRQQTLKLQAQSAEFDRVCSSVEARLVRAIAVLERDARKASGQSPLIASPSPPASPTIPSTSLALDLSSTALDLTSLADSDANMLSGLDPSFLHTSLFGDSVNPSLSASPIQPFSLLPPTSSTSMGEIPLLPSLTADGVTTSTMMMPVGGVDSEELANIMALLEGNNPGGLDPSAMPPSNIDDLTSLGSGVVSGGGLGMDLFATGGAFATGDPMMEGFGLSGLGAAAEGGEGGGGVDMSMMDFGLEGMDDWMKSFDAADTGAGS